MANTSTGNKDEAYAGLEAEVGRLREDIASLASTLKGIAGGEAKSAAEALRKGADRATAGAREAAEQAEATAREGINTLDANVRKDPWTAILVALGLGFLIGALTRR